MMSPPCGRARRAHSRCRASAGSAAGDRVRRPPAAAPERRKDRAGHGRARMEGAARRRMQRVGDVAWNGLEIGRGRVHAEPRYGLEQADGVRHARVPQHGPRWPILDARPAYMTRIRSAISAATPRLWVMKITAMPISRCRRAIRSRIWAWMVTSRAVVGSSAMSSPVGRRAPWRSSPAGACRRTSDADRHRGSAGSGMPSSSNISRAWARAAADVVSGAGGSPPSPARPRCRPG